MYSLVNTVFLVLFSFAYKDFVCSNTADIIIIVLAIITFKPEQLGMVESKLHNWSCNYHSCSSYCNYDYKVKTFKIKNFETCSCKSI